jgi:hypothetical protein
MLKVDHRRASIQVIEYVRTQHLPLLFRIPKEQANVALNGVCLIQIIQSFRLIYLLRFWPSIHRGHESK